MGNQLHQPIDKPRESRTALVIAVLALILAAPLIFAPPSDAGSTYLPLAFSAPLTPIPTETPLPTPTPILPPKTVDDIIARFKLAGLEAENAYPMQPQDYGFAPYLCSDAARRFFIPSLGPDKGRRLYKCKNTADASKLKKYYDDLGKQSALFFSWTYQNRGVLVQLNGELSATKAAAYGSVIAALH
jgi:hypothetical protein